MRVTIAIAALLAVASAGTARAATLHVPDQYPTIGSALAAASSGDAIHVDYGTYRESVTVATKSIEIDGYNGATLDGSVFAPATLPTGILIQSEEVKIKGLAIRNFAIGIGIAAGGSRTIEGDFITNCGVGVHCATGISVQGLPPIKKTLIDDNTMTGCGTGVFVDGSENVVVSNNTAIGSGTDPTGTGIFAGPAIEVSGSTGCTVDENWVCLNTSDGINISFSDSIAVTYNTVDLNGRDGIGNGISFSLAVTDSTVERNEANLNGGDGILMGAFSTGNTIGHCTALGNGHLDAEDVSGGVNRWTHNVFGRTAGF